MPALLGPSLLMGGTLPLPTFSTKATNTGTGLAPTLTSPPTRAVGDVLIVITGVGNASGGGLSGSAAGYTNFMSSDNNFFFGTAHYRVATNNSSDNFTTTTSDSSAWAVTMFVLKGVIGTTLTRPTTGGNIQSPSPSTVSNIPGVTMPKKGILLMGVNCVHSSSSTLTGPTAGAPYSTLDTSALTSGSLKYLQAVFAKVVAAGATGNSSATYTFTGGGNGNIGGATLGITL